MRLLCLLCLLVASSSASAEHRVALLIDNAGYEDDSLRDTPRDLDEVEKGLAKFGFRCTKLRDLSGTKLRSVLSSFAGSTPTRGTALVYFHGRVLPGTYESDKGLFLVGIDAKPGDPRRIGSAGCSLDHLLDSLNTEGGSSANLVVLDVGDKPPKYDKPLPKDTSLSFGELPTIKLPLTGADSRVVSPPDRFVEGKKAGDEWVNARGMVFCWCPPGTYLAGSPESEPGRYPDEKQREVKFEHGFWISKFELTLRENLRNHPRKTIATHKNHPLTMINHDDAKRMTSRTFTDAERKAGRLPSDWEYALPTGDQWEYAARAGTKTRFSFGDDENQLSKYANFGDKTFYDSKSVFANSAHRVLSDGVEKLAVVGSFEPNAWGLHDIHGNVAEWCLDTSIRGGSWVSQPSNCRCAHRDSFSSRNEQNFIGYRLVIRPVAARPKK